MTSQTPCAYKKPHKKMLSSFGVSPTEQVFTNTRDYHDARAKWLSNLPQYSIVESNLKPQEYSMFVDDLNGQFGGKAGVPFPFGICMYTFRHVLSGPISMLGYGKLIVQHFGSLFVIFDDLQAIAAGGSCLTKSIEVEVLAGFQLGGDYGFEIYTETQTNAKGKEVKTRVDMRDLNSGRVVAVSHGVFISNQVVLTVMANQVSQSLDLLWEKSSTLRLIGTGPNDAEMSFALHVPRVERCDLPPWWGESQLRHKPQTIGAFAGRIEFYHVESTAQSDGGVRAVVWLRSTCEGAPSLAHGGATVAACVDLLSFVIPQLQVSKVQVKFKRRIEVETKIVIECTPHAAEEKWNARILAWDRTLLQEIIVFQSANSKL